MNTRCHFCKEKEGTTFAYSGNNCVMVCDNCALKIQEYAKLRKEKEKNDSTSIFHKRHAN